MLLRMRVTEVWRKAVRQMFQVFFSESMGGNTAILDYFYILIPTPHSCLSICLICFSHLYFSVGSF